MAVPLDHQIEDARTFHYEMGGRGLAAWTQGLGKSLFALLCATKHPDLYFPMIVVCPAVAKHVWERQALEHFGMRACVLSGTRPPEEGLVTKRKLIVANYDILGRRRDEKKNFGPGWLDELKRIAPRFVVIDESQSLADFWSLRTQATVELCRGVPHVLALSGTPFNNRPIELFPTLHILDPDNYPNYYQFGHRFGGPRLTEFGWKFDGACNLDRLNDQLLGRVRGYPRLMLRRRAEDVLTDLPSIRRRVVPVPLSDRDQYDEAWHDFVLWLKKNRLDKLGRAEKAKGLTKVGNLKVLVGKLKLPAVVRWADDFLKSGDKLMIYCVHREIANALCERYRGVSVLVNGTVTGQKRREAIDRFNRDSRVRVFVGNIRAAGVALSVTSCSDVLFAELDWSPGSMDQAEKRIHGIARGQEGVRSNAWWSVARDSIEERICAKIQDKTRYISEALDGNPDASTLNILELLAEEAEVGGLFR